jgi:release factor glutamine methyltransferase
VAALPSPAPDPLVRRLREAGCVFAEDEARLLREAAPGETALEALALRRIAGEPLEYVLGWAEFRGRRLAVAPGVFVPRRRTELLAREAIRVTRPGAVVLDLCCGVGAVASAVAAAVPGIELHAADLDPAATACARRNLPGGAAVHTGDLYAALPPSLRERVDVLAANAPYVPTARIALMPPEARLHEAHAALDGGEDGLALQRRVAREGLDWLAPGGVLLLETSEQQAPATAALLQEAGLRTRTVRSERLDGTVVLGRHRGGAGGKPREHRVA